MHLAIERTQRQAANGLMEFVVTCRRLTLSAPEVEHLRRYGASDLVLWFDDIPELLAARGKEKVFDDVTAALTYIQKVQSACAVTEAYWAAASTFSGNMDYRPTP
jgi:hypothetical protein